MRTPPHYFSSNISKKDQTQTDLPACLLITNLYIIIKVDRRYMKHNGDISILFTSAHILCDFFCDMP
jgi:hypothetical protein